MKKVEADKPKRPRGRPRTGMQPALSARVPEDILQRVDQWAGLNACSRSEAIARLLTVALEQKPGKKKRP